MHFIKGISCCVQSDLEKKIIIGGFEELESSVMTVCEAHSEILEMSQKINTIVRELEESK